MDQASTAGPPAAGIVAGRRPAATNPSLLIERDGPGVVVGHLQEHRLGPGRGAPRRARRQGSVRRFPGRRAGRTARVRISASPAAIRARMKPAVAFGLGDEGEAPAGPPSAACRRRAPGVSKPAAWTAARAARGRPGARGAASCGQLGVGRAQIERLGGASGRARRRGEARERDGIGAAGGELGLGQGVRRAGPRRGPPDGRARKGPAAPPRPRATGPPARSGAPVPNACT